MEEYSHLRKVYLYLHLVYLLVHWHSADMADMVICLSWLNLGPSGFPALCLVTILMGWTSHVLLTTLHCLDPWSLTDYLLYTESIHDLLLTTLHWADPWSLTDYFTLSGSMISYWLLYTEWIHDLLLTTLHWVDPWSLTDYFRLSGSVIYNWQLYTGCIRGLLYFTQGRCIMSYLMTTVVMGYPNFLLPI